MIDITNMTKAEVNLILDATTPYTFSSRMGQPVVYGPFCKEVVRTGAVAALEYAQKLADTTTGHYNFVTVFMKASGRPLKPVATVYAR
jgi:hypothetical protein